MLFFWTFYSSVNPVKIKSIMVSIKILCSTTVFNIDNNQKCFLSSKSAYYYDFWRSCDTEDCSNDAENTALITEINYSLTDIHIEKAFLNCNYFTIVLYFCSSRFSLGEQNRLLSNTHKNRTDHSFWNSIVILHFLISNLPVTVLFTKDVLVQIDSFRFICCLMFDDCIILHMHLLTYTLACFCFFFTCFDPEIL